MPLDRVPLLALSLAAAVALQGCGRDAASTPPVTAARAGAVQLPAGSTLGTSAVTAHNSLDTTTVSSTGAFQLLAFTEGPQFTYVVGPSGVPVYFGFLSAAEPNLNARTTAEALVFHALGYYLLPATERLQAYAAIASSPGFSALESAINSALVRHPDAFTAATTYPQEVAAAVQTFLSTLKATPNPLATLAEKAIAAGARDGATHAAVVSGGSILVNPSNAQSGLTVLNREPLISFQNEYLRRTAAFFDQVGYVIKSGEASVFVPAPKPDVVTPIELPVPTALKSFKSTATDIMNGNYAWSPVESERIALPLAPDSYWTKYRITTVGGGEASANDLQLTSEQVQAADDLFWKTAVLDVFMPALSSVLLPFAKEAGLTSGALADAYGGSLAKDLLTSIVSVRPAVLSAFKNRDYKGAGTIIWTAVASSSIAQKAALNLLAYLAQQTDPAIQAQWAANFGSTVALWLKLADAGLVGINSMAMFADLARSQKTDFFDVVVVQTKIVLSPATSTVYNGFYGTPSFVVNVPSAGGSGLVLEYEWHNTAQFGRFCDLSALADHCDSFTSTQNQGTYLAKASGQGTDTLTVTVTAVDMSGDKPLRFTLGTASATIAVAALPDVGLPPTNLPQSRCLQLAASPHIVTVGQTVTGTGSGYSPLNCGGDLPPQTPPTWTWSGISGTVISGCTPNALSCAFTPTAATGTAGSRYVRLCVNGSSRQGSWTSCDAYAVAP